MAVIRDRITTASTVLTRSPFTHRICYIANHQTFQPHSFQTPPRTGTGPNRTCTCTVPPRGVFYFDVFFDMWVRVALLP